MTEINNGRADRVSERERGRERREKRRGNDALCLFLPAAQPPDHCRSAGRSTEARKAILRLGEGVAPFFVLSVKVAKEGQLLVQV